MDCLNPRFLFVLGQTAEGKLITYITDTSVRKIAYHSVKNTDKKPDARYGHYERDDFYYDLYSVIRCGKCEACREKAAKDWSIRACMESQTRGEPYFLTLTYDEEHYVKRQPKKDFQDFMKRLRNNQEQRLSYLASMEEGDQTHRLHYHAVVWGLKLNDLRTFATGWKYTTYTSETIAKTWGLGFVYIGKGNTAATARYVAAYTKKGEHAIMVSKRPAIGKEWLDKNGYRESFQLEGQNHIVKMPRYGIKLLSEKQRQERRERLAQISRNNLTVAETGYRNHYDSERLQIIARIQAATRLKKPERK